MFALLALLSCAAEVPLSEIEVASADLVGISMTTAAVVAGGGGGSASLVVTEPDGDTHTFPVAIRVVTAGAVVEVDHTLDFGNDRALDLPEGERLTADQLLGRYRGVAGSLTVGAGVTGHRLRNRHGVVLDKAMFAVGVGIFAGWKQLHLSLGDRYGEVHDWEDFIIEDSPDLEDTAPDDTADTAPADDTAPFDDTGLAADSGGAPEPPSGSTGCGCAGGRSDATWEDSSSPEPPSSGGAGCDASGCDAGSGGCVGCGTSGGAPAGWLGLIALITLRRRR